MNRKLIRPNLTEYKDKISKSAEAEPKPPLPHSHPHPHPHQAPPSHPSPSSAPQQQQQGPKRIHPPTDTFAENYYYLKQMSKKTAMAVVFNDGQVIEGYIEWYDRNCIKLNRDNAPNLLVFKAGIKYMYKLDEAKESGEGEADDRK
jgi:sRNA-binding regulator protein Hfq